MTVAFAFDLDGTLLTLPVDIDAVRARAADVLRARGFDGELRPILATIEQAAAELATSEADRLELVGAARAEIDAGELAASTAATVCAGAVRTLRAARDGGFSFGIVTNNSRLCVAPAMRAAGLADLVGDAPIITRDDVGEPKPHPEGVARMARTLLPAGGVLVFVGDGRADVEAGARAAAVVAPENIEVRTFYVGCDADVGAMRTLTGLDELAEEIEAGDWTG